MRRWSFVVGVVLIALGVLAVLRILLGALGISFHIGWVFWPLVLIGVGVWIIQGVSRGGRVTAGREETSIPLDGAKEASVVVHHGAGRLSIAAGAAPDQLLSGSFGGGLDASRTRNGDRLDVDMKVKDRDVSHYIFPGTRGWAGVLDWNFSMNSSVPLSLRLETGASETRLSLTDLQIRELVLKTGASATTIDLPARAGFTRFTAEFGAASVKVRVPQGVAASIQVRGALSGIHVDRMRFPQFADGYKSTDYESAANKVEIFVETGVGSIEIS
jgi:hypothetical protein